MLLITALSASLFTGCSKHPAPGALTSSASIAIEPGVSFGPVRAGMKQRDVVAVLGEPNDNHDGVLRYHDLGITLLPGKGGFLEGVICFNGNVPFKSFAGHTKEGIGIGSSRVDVIKAYGEPTSVKIGRGVPEHSTLVYETRAINFHIREDKVYQMAVFLRP